MRRDINDFAKADTTSKKYLNITQYRGEHKISMRTMKLDNRKTVKKNTKANIS